MDLLHPQPRPWHDVAAGVTASVYLGGLVYLIGTSWDGTWLPQIGGLMAGRSLWLLYAGSMMLGLGVAIAELASSTEPRMGTTLTRPRLVVLGVGMLVTATVPQLDLLAGRLVEAGPIASGVPQLVGLAGLVLTLAAITSSVARRTGSRT